MPNESSEAGGFYKARMDGPEKEIFVFINGGGLQFQILEKVGLHWQRSPWRDVTELSNWEEHVGGHFTARRKGGNVRITIYAVCDSYLKLSKQNGLWFEANAWAPLSELEDFMPYDLT